MLPPGGGAVPDYTKQLEEIIRLLSRRGISPWVLAAFAALLGVVGGAVGRAIEPLIADISRRRGLRRVLYGDLAGMFFQVDTITTFGERWANDHVRDDAFHRLSGDLDFQAEAYISANRDVFMQLRERQAANHVYRLLHRIIDDVPRNMETNCRAVQWMIGKYLRDGSLNPKYFGRSLPKNQARRLITRATELYDESIRQEQELQKENQRYLGT